MEVGFGMLCSGLPQVRYAIKTLPVLLFSIFHFPFFSSPQSLSSCMSSSSYSQAEMTCSLKMHEVGGTLVCLDSFLAFD